MEIPQNIIGIRGTFGIMKRLLRKMKRWTKAIGSYGIMGAYFKEKYARTILKTGPIICGVDNRLELHTLACEWDLLNTLWSLKTFYHFSGRKPGLVIYDDGSLSESTVHIFSEHFVNCKIIRREAFHQDMKIFLQAHEETLKYSSIKSFYCALKFFGPMYYTKSGHVLYLDSDVLFFRKPIEMLHYIESGKPFYMSDYQDACSYPVEFLNQLLGIGLHHKINAGLFHVARSDFAAHLDLVEEYFKNVSALFNTRHSVNRHEQTLAAILLSMAKAVRLDSTYQISKTRVTDKTVSHHFVNDGSRMAFYVSGLRRLKSTGFIEQYESGA